MKTNTQSAPRKDGGRTISNVLVLLVSVFVSVRLLTLDASLLESAQSIRTQTTSAGRYGSLSGHRAIDNTVWLPGNRNGEEQYVILFPISADTAGTDIEYWNDIASMSRHVAPELEFVAICDKGNACASLAGATAFTVLAFMDISQMHAVAIARREGQALLYRGPALASTFFVTEDRADLVAAIASIVNEI